MNQASMRQSTEFVSECKGVALLAAPMHEAGAAALRLRVAVNWWRHTADRRFFSVILGADSCWPLVAIERAVIDDIGNLVRVS